MTIPRPTPYSLPCYGGVALTGVCLAVMGRVKNIDSLPLWWLWFGLLIVGLFLAINGAVRVRIGGAWCYQLHSPAGEIIHIHYSLFHQTVRGVGYFGADGRYQSVDYDLMMSAIRAGLDFDTALALQVHRVKHNNDNNYKEN